MRSDGSDGLLAARRQFLREGRLPPALAGVPIARSWQRCAAFGLDMAAFPRIEPMTAAELREAASPHDRLRHLCRAELEALRQEAQLTGSVIILTDPGGVVLESFGSAEFADKAAQVALRPGVRWSEDHTGTNAIGTAIHERRAIEVRGREHYFDTHAILTCAASPILDPHGAIAGTLDMSGAASVDHRHAMGLVRMAVEQIEHRFFEEGFADAEIVRFHVEPDLVGTVREGIAVFRDQRLVAANRHALKLMGLDWSALDARLREDLFEQLPNQTGTLTRLHRRSGSAVFARVSQPAPQQSRARRPVPEVVSAHWFDAATEAMVARARRLVDADVPVLVTGESGTGKEVFARRLHAESRRAGQPFVAVNCAALPESLIEAELFGYADGAFTGARRQGAKGLIREAAGGILFLDEIGDMPVGLQARLLRVLQDKEVRPLGSAASVPVNFALICATHRDLSALMEQGAFRPDLYFRLAQYPFELPALRSLAERESVVAGLAQQALAPARLSPEALALLAAYDWPGNFRQLAGTLKALKALAQPGETVTADLLPAPIRRVSAPASPLHAGDLASVEREAMRRALDASRGNVSKAARALGINRSTIYRRMLQS